MKSRKFKRLFSALLALLMIVGVIPAMATANLVTVTATEGTAGESAQNPILISSMEQLIEEFEKDTEGATYYRLTEDISHETSIDHYDTGAEWKTGDDGYDTVRTPYMAQCVVGTGKKFLELDGFDIHYKNNVNFIARDTSKKNGYFYDSLTFFYLQNGCDLTVTNSTKDEARVWYDGWMHNRTNFFSGPNYIYTAVRDVFHVEAGAELTVNNTYVKAGRNRKIWMVNSFYLDKDPETNLLIKLTYNGYAYEQIYGSAIVTNGGKVTINGGYIEGRGGYRDKFNICGVPQWKKDDISNMFWGGDFTTDSMMDNCLSKRGAKAAVQIAGEGSTVIINGGEFWGNGGANVIGINTLTGAGVNEYTLRINAGTFDTSKTDKERVPDRNAGSVNNGPWVLSASDWNLWANCRCIRDTLRGYIGIPAVDGYGVNVFNTKMTHVYIDDEEPESECIDNEELDFTRKSDSDTIIVKPREREDYGFSCTITQKNYRGDEHGGIYVYSGGEMITFSLYGANSPMNYEPAVSQGLYFSAESHYDFSDEDNPYFKVAHTVQGVWTIYIEDSNGNHVGAREIVTAPFHTENRDGRTIYNFKTTMNAFKDVEWNEDYKYYVIAGMKEVFQDRYTTYTTVTYKYGVLDNSIHDGLNVVYDPDYCSSFASSGATVTYSNAAYNCDPVLTFNSAYEKLKGSKIYQWQVLENDEWIDYGNTRISPELAVEILLKHENLVGKQVRMKITSYDGIYKDALYSNVCEVLPDHNTRMPSTGKYVWSEDPNHSGKYILESTLNNGMQEFLIQLHEDIEDISELDWSNATDEPYFDNLDMGYYDIYTRFKATEDYYAGTEVICSRAVVGPYTLTQGFEVQLNSNTVDTVIVELGKLFCLQSVALPEDASDKSIIDNTVWSPETDKTDMLLRYYGEDYAFDSDYIAPDIWLRGNKLGTVNVTATVTLDDGKTKSHIITVHVVPEGYVPYTVSVINNGTKVAIGDSFIPRLRLHDRKESGLNSSEILESDIKVRLESQILASKVNWTLRDGLLSQKDRNTITNGLANININSGKITLNSTAEPGDVIRYIGYLEDPYIGTIEIPGYIKVVAAPTVEVHTHDYVSYVQNDDSTHYRYCDCGDRVTEEHDYTSYIVQEATDTTEAVVGMICSCGYYYETELEDSMVVHSHNLDYIYNQYFHWQICDDEECPIEYSTARKSHNLVLQYTDDSGRSCYSCSICKCIVTDGLIKASDGICYYYADGKVDTTYTGMVENAYGVWYVKNGKLDTTYTGMCIYGGKCIYVNKGLFDTTYTGLAKNASGVWYMKKGVLDLTYTGMAKDGSDLWYVKEGKVDTSFTGLYVYGGKCIYVNKGKFDTTYTGLAKNASGVWYMKKGVLDLTYTGMAKDGSDLWYVKEGKVDTSFTGLYVYGGKCIYVNKGKFDTTYTGLAKNASGVWHMKKGVLDLTYTGMAKDGSNLWYVKEGKVDTTFTGLYVYGGKCIYVNKGKFDTTYTGLAKNASGIWYIKNGVLDLTYTGMAKNAYGLWYVKEGKLDTSFTGLYVYGGKCIYVNKGKFDTTYTGAVKNASGVWYIKNGVLDLTYNGTVVYGGKIYTVVNGKVIIK